MLDMLDYDHDHDRVDWADGGGSGGLEGISGSRPGNRNDWYTLACDSNFYFLTKFNWKGPHFIYENHPGKMGIRTRKYSNFYIIYE